MKDKIFNTLLDLDELVVTSLSPIFCLFFVLMCLLAGLAFGFVIKTITKAIKFVKEKFTLKALKMLDKKERYSQRIRQKQAKRDYEYNKKQTQINQSIDSLFGNLQKDTQSYNKGA